MKITTRSPIFYWLIILCVQVLLIVLVGGITRLTDSGLSMTQWKPIMGSVPPTNPADWDAAFDLYKQYPQYQQLNPDMSLGAFKAIFFWEYLHRMLARALSVVFLVPWLIFLVRKRITKGVALRLFGGFLLGGLQGLAGWFMVKSGLSENPYVSHYRLAIHFSLALGIFAYFLWLILRLTFPGIPDQDPILRKKGLRLSLLLFSLLAVQVVYGAFVAGLDAGEIHNTFPHMSGSFLPAAATELEPFIQNLVQNPAMVQFMHRGFAWLLLAAALGAWFFARKQCFHSAQLFTIKLFASLIVLQFGLGVITVITHVELIVAVMHQLMACLLVGAGVGMIFVHTKAAAAE